MKKTWLPLAIAALFTLFIIDPAAAQERDNSQVRASPNASVSQTIGTTVVTVGYSRPGIKGRDVWGGLVPYDQVWRAGANEATSVTVSDEVMVGDQTLPAGSYSLFILPKESGPWTVIFNQNIAWGTQYDESQDVIRVDVEPQEADSYEWLMYKFMNLSNNSADLVMHWSNVKLPIPISVN